MPLTIMPSGVRCNLKCGYCYENSMRRAGNLGGGYSFDDLKKGIDQHGQSKEPFLLFGGEALLLPKGDLEQIWALGFSRASRNIVQTNGSLIDDDHIRMFRKYNVSVGISVDGPGELNDARWNGSLERTRIATERSLQAIKTLCERGPVPGLVVTLSRFNAIGNRLERLIEWFGQLNELGIKSIGLHLVSIEDNSTRDEFELSPEEAVCALMRIRKCESHWIPSNLHY